jgi:hypothetical protein
MTKNKVEFLDKKDISHFQKFYKVYSNSKNIVKKKFVNWISNDYLFYDFFNSKKLPILVVWNKKQSKILSCFVFYISFIFINKKKKLSLWNIFFINSSNPGFSLLMIKKISKISNIICGNHFSKNSFASFNRYFSEKLLSEVPRKIAIIDNIICNKYLNKNNNALTKKFIDSNLASINRRKIYEILDLNNIQDIFWIDHQKRFRVTFDRSKSFIKWRFINHPYKKYTIIASDSYASKGLAICTVESLPRFNVLRIMDLMPKAGHEKDLIELALNYAKNKNCILADFFCTHKYISKICMHPFVDFNEHKKYNIPYLFNPVEIRENKSFNLYISKQRNSYKDLYCTKSDGESQLF